MTYQFDQSAQNLGARKIKLAYASLTVLVIIGFVVTIFDITLKGVNETAVVIIYGFFILMSYQNIRRGKKILKMKVGWHIRLDKDSFTAQVPNSEPFLIRLDEILGVEMVELTSEGNPQIHLLTDQRVAWHLNFYYCRYDDHNLISTFKQLGIEVIRCKTEDARTGAIFDKADMFNPSVYSI